MTNGRLDCFYKIYVFIRNTTKQSDLILVSGQPFFFLYSIITVLKMAALLAKKKNRRIHLDTLKALKKRILYLKEEIVVLWNLLQVVAPTSPVKVEGNQRNDANNPMLCWLEE